MKIIRGESKSEPFFACISDKRCVFDEDVIKRVGAVGALRVDVDGYMRLRRVPFHQLIFCVRYPDAKGLHIDHINRDRLDNRFDNLQALDARTHMQKTRLENAKGYSKRASGGYEVDVQWNGQRHHLGTYRTAAHARAAWTDWHLTNNQQWLIDTNLYNWMLSELVDAVWSSEQE